MKDETLCQKETMNKQLIPSEKRMLSEPNDSMKNTNQDCEKKNLTDIMKISGIYKIINKVNGKYYVGSSGDIETRWYDHKYNARRNIHKNSHFQSAWNKYGEHNFDFIVIEPIYRCNTDSNKKFSKKLLLAEQKYLDVAKMEQQLAYNIYFIADGGMLGRKHSDKSKKLISKAIRNKYNEGYMRWNKGKRLTAEHRDKISKTRILKQIKPSRKQRKMQSKMVSGKNNYFYGKSLTGDKNGRYDSTIYTFYNIKTNEKFTGTRYDFYTKYDGMEQNLTNLISGKNGKKSIKGWTLNPNIPIGIPRGESHPRTDKKIYNFYNLITKELFVGLRLNFIKKHNLNRTGIRNLVTGKLTNYKNWVIHNP
jgi:group I intron endonuclease